MVLALVQVAVIMTVLASMVMMIVLGLATAGLTNSPEHAQVTTLPVSLGVIAVASRVGISGTEKLTWVKRLIPGGLAHRIGRQGLERRCHHDRLADVAGTHPRLGRHRRPARHSTLPLGTTLMTTPAAETHA